MYEDQDPGAFEDLGAERQLGMIGAFVNEFVGLLRIAEFVKIGLIVQAATVSNFSGEARGSAIVEAAVVRQARIPIRRLWTSV